MGEAKEVRLYGMWASSYCAMVHSALKLKGVSYDYVEEDLAHKSEELLRLNPVHKSVPVLVVDGTAVAESAVILEFVEDVWKEPPLLLPVDPYLRATVRFWVNFIYQKLMPASYTFVRLTGEEQEKTAKEIIDYIITLEHGLQKDLPRTTGAFIHGEAPGMLDVILGSCGSGLRILGQFIGTEILHKERTPLLSSAVAAFSEVEVVKDGLIPEDKLIKHVQFLREKALATAT